MSITLSKGHGPKALVKRLQTALVARGYDLGTAGADGIFGEKTASAIRAFQKSNHLPVTGVANPATIDKMDLDTETLEERLVIDTPQSPIVRTPLDVIDHFVATIERLDTKYADAFTAAVHRFTSFAAFPSSSDTRSKALGTFVDALVVRTPVLSLKIALEAVEKFPVLGDAVELIQEAYETRDSEATRAKVATALVKLRDFTDVQQLRGLLMDSYFDAAALRSALIEKANATADRDAFVEQLDAVANRLHGQLPRASEFWFHLHTVELIELWINLHFNGLTASIDIFVDVRPGPFRWTYQSAKFFFPLQAQVKDLLLNIVRWQTSNSDLPLRKGIYEKSFVSVLNVPRRIGLGDGDRFPLKKPATLSDRHWDLTLGTLWTKHSAVIDATGTVVREPTDPVSKSLWRAFMAGESVWEESAGVLEGAMQSKP